MNAGSAAETPRNNKQIYNFKHNEHSKFSKQQGKKDEIYAFMLQAAEEEEERERALRAQYCSLARAYVYSGVSVSISWYSKVLLWPVSS